MIKETTVSDQVAMVPRRSGREIRLPSRYRQDNEANTVTETNNDNLLTYRDAMVDCDKEQW